MKTATKILILLLAFSSVVQAFTLSQNPSESPQGREAVDHEIPGV
jgi:hypothetical protein